MTKIEPPEMHLEAKLKEKTQNGCKAMTSMTSAIVPELDGTPELDQDDQRFR